MEALNFKPRIQTLFPPPSIPLTGATKQHPAAHVTAMGRSSSNGILQTSSSSVVLDNQPSSRSRFLFIDPLISLWSGGEEDKQNDENTLILNEEEERETDETEETESGVEGDENEGSEKRKGNWVLKILRIRSMWRKKDENLSVMEEKEKEEEREKEERGEGSCSCEVSEEKEEEVMEFDRESFSRLLQKVSLGEARLFAQLSYLGSLAYNVPNIKSKNLLKKYEGLHFVTSSLDKKAESIHVEKEQTSVQVQGTEDRSEEIKEEVKCEKKNGNQISASTAYRIAAAAASYVQSHTRSILPFKLSNHRPSQESTEGGIEADGSDGVSSSEVASFMATTNSLTAVVAAKEEMKEAVAKDLNSVHSSPCQWFICDDNQSGTRIFVIQGSESISSWQANLLFEPIQFEGFNVLVHRGIYEAAKGIYEQMLPEVRAHLKSRGDSATFRFTGHSLGGSLSVLVNLMLLIRGEVALSSLLPVVTFGAPTIMCGGDQLLHKLGLPRNHVQAITLHRDIVPRVFSCNYPDHVIEILKALNSNFRNHPCLKKQKLLYAPMGEILILQPDESISPCHHLLPSGNGLYLLSCAMTDLGDPEKLIRAAQNVFFNSPHPLEILSDRSSYGSDGAIYRDHDMKAYLRSVRGVIRQELNHIRKARREKRRQLWWSILVPQGMQTGITVGRQMVSSSVIQRQMKLFGIIETGGKSLKRFSRFVTSQNVHFFVVLLLPARLILLGVESIFSFN